QDDDCVARVKNVLSQDSINYDALFQDGLLNLAKGDAIGAIRDFEYLSNAYRQNPLVRYQLALAYLLYSNAKDVNEETRRKAVEAERKQPERGGNPPPSQQSGGDVGGKSKAWEGHPRRCRGVVGAVDKGAAADCASAIPARYRLFGPTEERPSVGGLPKDDGI